MERTKEEKIAKAKELRSKWMWLKAIWSLLKVTAMTAHNYVKHGEQTTKVSKKPSLSFEETIIKEVAVNVKPEFTQPDKYRIVNLTPHPIRFWKQEIPSNWFVRVEKIKKQIWDINWIPVFTRIYNALDLEVPAPKDWVVYIVSNLTAAAYPTRRDIYTVNTDQVWYQQSIEGIMLNPYLKL